MHSDTRADPAAADAALAPTPARTRPHLLDASMFWAEPGNGGVHRALSNKRSFFRARGWRHTLLAPGARGAGQLDAGGVPIPASGGYRFVVDRLRAVRLIEQAEPDIIEAADPYTLGWAALDASARLKVPAVAFCHSNMPVQVERLVADALGAPARRVPWVERHAGRYLARLYERYDLVLAPSRTMTAQLHERGVRQAVQQPLGVDTTVFSPAANDPRWRYRLEDELELAAGTRLVVYAGRFAPEKNLDLLTDAVRRLGPRHVLLAVGSGPRPPRGAQVRVLPPETDSERLARLLATCDVFAHAGDHETFGLAALEAMACGTPVVVSAAGGLGELAEDVGITVASQRADDWAAAIAACLADPHSALAWMALARARTFDWSVVLDQLSRRYLQAMQHHPSGHASVSASALPQTQP